MARLLLKDFGDGEVAALRSVDEIEHAQLRERVRVLEAELEAIKITRNSYQTENGQLKKQIAAMKRQAGK